MGDRYMPYLYVIVFMDLGTKLLSGWLGFPVEGSIVQANTVGHTGASGFQRLANQACFVGEVERGERWMILSGRAGLSPI